MRDKIKDLIKFALAYIASRILLFFPQYRNIWIITERRHECKDNGYYFFQYMRKFYPETKTYYAIDLDSPHLIKIQDLGNVIGFNSWKHYILALAATRLIGAFLPCGIPDSVCFYKFGHKLIGGKKCFLQHGIVKEKISSLIYEHTNLDLFICGAKPEYDFISDYFHYPKDNVAYTGLCRYDGLIDVKAENIILIMPTWRKWIPSATWKYDKNSTSFEQYEYFYRYKELVTSKEIHSLAQKSGYQVIFYLHHEMQPYRDYFFANNQDVIIATEEEYDVQRLLKACACLITDYSSVAFDVAYMGKPVIYYQFDEDEYYAKHYQRGYFNYDTMGFGPKCLDIQDVIYALEKCVKNDMKMSAEYKQRSESFFVYRDTDNCKRVYEKIVGLK